ncbi:MAG: hypothetical protein DHS20C17_10480 [Cyclobacteriaceae bacterium]|nr:MAG: hypothetical protein DHS20C17_10480 [Cyclobacteriaceae bacterium]
MALKALIQQLGAEKSTPCVTISLNTHRTFPDNESDRILLKNLLKEAKERVVHEFGGNTITGLLKNIDTVQNEVDVNRNLDSLYIFLSNKTKEIVTLPQVTHKSSVQISNTFALRPLIKAYSRSTTYLIMLLSQGGVHLYEAINDEILQEIKNEDFPFPENTHNLFFPERKSDPEYVDDLIKGYFNKIDKALVKIHNKTDLKCVVVCTVDNYGLLMQVADKPAAYYGYVRIDYNNSAPHQIVQPGWELVKTLVQQQKKAAIEKVKEAVAQGKVQTDLQEIYQSAIDGRGDLLILHQDFVQPVMMKDDRTFEFIENPSTPGAIDDITSNIIWQVLEKKGSVVFTTQEEIKDLGKIVLKTRY